MMGDLSGRKRACLMAMIRKLAILFLLFGAATGMAASNGFPLGIDSTGPSAYGNPVATDNSGASYFADPDVNCSTIASSGPCVTKLAPDGKTVVWQNSMPYGVQVDPNGGVYTEVQDANTGGLYVEKLGVDGNSIVWKVPVATGPGPVYWSFTVDPTGRVYGAITQSSQSVLVRVKADGSGIDYTAPLAGLPKFLAADGAGSAILVLDVSPQPQQQGTVDSYVLTRLSADGSSQLYSIPISLPTAMAADAAGDVAVLLYNPVDAESALFPVLQRFNPQGEQTVWQPLPRLLSYEFFGITIVQGPPSLAMDPAGNMYVAGAFFAHSVRNSLAPCRQGAAGPSLLVYGPDGSLLQGTYLPGFNPGFPGSSNSAVAGGTGGVVYVIAGDLTLTRLLQNSAAQTIPLACVANAASYTTLAVAPGEIVALFGNGIGPQQGIVTTATLQSPFPTQQGGVEVTFDSTPAPLLWVQDGQVNAVVPWGLTPGQNTSVCVSYNGVATNCLTQPVAQTSPGVFTVDGYYASARNQDGTINSAANPVPVNQEITFYATGMGPINPAQGDGSLVGLPLPVNVLPVVAGMTGPPMGVLLHQLFQDYGGPAPYELAGVTQVNCHFSGTPPFPYPFVVTTGSGDQSNPFGIYITGP
jgi:uncharacterized protein (TIGR03437 family)